MMSLEEGLNAFYAAQAATPKTLGESVKAVGNRPWTKKIVSHALAVHVSQVEEAREQAKRDGLPGVDVRPDGAIVVSSAHQFREYAKSRGYRHYGY